MTIFKKWRQKKGFSLVELIVVIAIIGIVTAIVIPSVIAYMNKGTRNAALSEAEIVKEDLNTWYKAFDEDTAASYRGKNLIYDFVDSEVQKDETYYNKLTYAYIPQEATTLYADSKGTSKYYANGKEAFNDDYALLVYNNGKLSVPIILPLSENYYFTGNATVYQGTFKSDAKLFKSYCAIDSLTNANNIYDLKDRSVSVRFVDYNGTLVGNIYSGITAGDTLSEVPSTTSMYVPNGYTFTGKWKVSGTDAELTSEQVLNYKITRDIKFEAVYAAKKYYVNFYMDYNKTIAGVSYDYYDESSYQTTGVKSYAYSDSQVLAYGDTLTETIPTRDGYTFSGWMLGDGTKVLSNASINASFSDVYQAIKKIGTIDDSGSETTIDLYAIWEKDTVSVTLMGYNKGKIATITVPYDSAITSSNIISYTSTNSSLSTNSSICNAYFGFTSAPGNDYSYVLSANATSETNVGIGASGAYSGWSWYEGSSTSSLFDIKTRIRRDYVLYAEPNYSFYAATSRNGLISSTINTDSNLYFKVADSVIQGNETMILGFFNDSADGGVWSSLELVAVKDGYHIYCGTRNTKYSSFVIARMSSESSKINLSNIWATTPQLTYDTSTKKNVYVITGTSSAQLTVENTKGSDTYVTSLNKMYLDVSLISNYSSYTYYVSYNGTQKQIYVNNSSVDSLYLVDVPSGVTSYTIVAKSGSTTKFTSNSLDASATGGHLYYVTAASGSSMTIANTITSSKYTITLKWSGNAAQTIKDTTTMSLIVNGSKTISMTIDFSNKTATAEITSSYTSMVLHIYVKSTSGPSSTNDYSATINLSNTSGTIDVTDLTSSGGKKNKTYSISCTASASADSSITNSFLFSSTQGEISLVPSIGGLNTESDGTISGYISLIGGSSTALRVLWNKDGEQIWLGYDALDEETKNYTIISKGSNSDDLCSPIMINASSTGTYLVSVVYDKDDDCGVPKIHIESSNVRLINYYRVSSNGNVEQVAYQQLPDGTSYSQLYCSYLDLNTEGYSWSGEWYLNKSLTGETFNYTDTSGTVTSDLDLYAKMNANTFSVTYDADTDKVATDTSSYPTTYTYDGTTFTLPKLSDSTGFYKFDGWYVDEEFTTAIETLDNNAVQYADEETGTISVYAKWEKASYIITYTLYGGEFEGGANPNPTSYTSGETLSALVNPTRNGYTFGGWYYDSDCTDIVTEGIIDTTRGGKITLYAKWVLEMPSSVTLTNSTTSEVSDLLATGEATVSADINDSTTLTAEATLAHEVTNLTLRYKWLSTSDITGYDEDEDVVSSNAKCTVTEEGTYTYYVLIQYYDATSRSVVQTLSYAVHISAYDSKLADTTVVYNGSAQTISLPSTYVTKITEDGWSVSSPVMALVNDDETTTPVTEAVEPGKYLETVTITKSGEEDIVKTGYLTITKKPIYIINNAVFEFDGSNHSISVPVDYAMDGEDTTGKVLSINGTVEASAVGNYSFTATILDLDHYAWSDDSTQSLASKVISWKITQTAVNLPSDYTGGKNIVDYTGNEQDITEIIPELASSAQYSIVDGSVTKATVCGTYTITLHLTSTDSCWFDGETDDRELTWTIQKATPTFTTKPTAASIYDGDTLEASAISGGVAVINEGEDNETVVSGTYTWDEPTKVVNYNFIATSYLAVFTPDDTDNYNIATVYIAVKVEKLTIKTSDVVTAPTAGTYYSHFDSISENTLTGGEVQLTLNGVATTIDGTFEWVDETKKYKASDATDGELEVAVTFVPSEAGKYSIDSSFSLKVKVPYVQDSYTVTLSGDNGHITQYYVTYNGSQSKTVTVGSSTDIEVLIATPSITVTVNSWEVESGSSFSYIIFDRTKQTNSTFNITKAGTLLIATTTETHTVTITNVTGLNITAVAQVEDYDNYLSTGERIKEVTVTTGTAVPQGSVIEATYNIDVGYKLTGITIRDDWWTNLYTTPLPTGQAITNKYVASFSVAKANVTITGAVQEMKIQVTVRIEDDSNGLGTVYVKGDVTGQITAADDEMLMEFGINASQTFYIETSSPSGYTISDFAVNGVTPSGFSEAQTYKSSTITADNQSDDGTILITIRFNTDTSVLSGISNTIQEALYEYRLTFSSSYTYELMERKSSDSGYTYETITQTNGYITNGTSILGIMFGGSKGMGYTVENYGTYYLKIYTSNTSQKFTFSSDNGYGDYMGFRKVDEGSGYVTYRFTMLTTVVCTKITVTAA